MSLMQTKFFVNALGSPRMVAILKSFVPALDRFLQKFTRGWVNTAMQPVAHVETLGAKSGVMRPLATLCMPVTTGFALVGSNWGGDRDPAWIHNLRANPHVKIVFRGFVGRVRAREIMGEERDALWDRSVAYNPQYKIYEASTSRLLPVMLLEK